MTGAIHKAEAAWPKPIPDWVEGLAEAIDNESQNRIASRIGLSPATVSLVIGRIYPGKYENVEEKVREYLLAEGVHCPFLDDEISFETCNRNQGHARSDNKANGLRILQARACKECVNWKEKS